MKIIQLILTLIIFQTSTCAYTVYGTPPNYYRQYYTRPIFNRGVMTGIPVPIYSTTPIYQPSYIDKRHIKKKYRNLYPSNYNSSFSIINH